MKTILKDLSTGLFFKGPDEWTVNPAEARDFKLIDRALEFIREFRLQETRVVFSFRDHQEIVTVPPDRLSE
ncbi:MAG: hypothetical protein WCR20_02000 [Verrucomicrobiota bacterium]|jgi:hypothetical protein|nr:hypothetical protein [Verrucomicrobiota bacterium]